MSHLDESPHKRQRISKACETCRKRKSKCDGIHPVCSICISHNRVCTYDNGGRRRGLQSGYVRSMETLLGILVQDLPDAEHKLRQLLRQSEIGRQIGTPMFAENVTNVWHESHLHEDIKKLLDNPDNVDLPAIDSFLPTTAQGQTASTNSASLVIPRLPTPGSPLCLPQPTCRVEVAAKEESYEELLVDGPELVDSYFIHIHPLLPIVERRDILCIMHSSNNLDYEDTNGNGYYICMLSIIALMLASGKQSCKMGPKFAKLLHRIQTHVTVNVQDYSSGHLQATLILVLTKICLGQLNAAWILLGQISRMTVSFMNGNFSSSSRLPHVLQACRILDIFVCALLDRSSHFSFTNHISMHVGEDGLDEWEGWRGSNQSSSGQSRSRNTPLRALSIFNEIAQLMLRLQSFLSSCHDQTTSWVGIEQIHQWWKNLPSHCNPPDSIHKTPCVLSLQLFYHFAVTTVYKTIDKTVSESNMSLPTASDVARSALKLWKDSMEITSHIHPLIKVVVGYSIACLETMHTNPIDPTVNESIRMLKTFEFGTVSELPPPPLSSTQSVPNLGHDLSTDIAMDNYLITASDPLHLQAQSLLSLSSNAAFSQIAPNQLGKRDRGHYSVIEKRNDSQYGVTAQQSPLENSFDAFLESDLEAILDELPLYTADDISSPGNEFVQNLGFLNGDMDSEFLALIGPDDALK